MTIKGPRFQRGILHPIGFWTGDSDTITVSGETSININDPFSPFNARVGVRVNSDGTIDKMTNNGTGGDQFTQIDASTDWIIPLASAPGTYQAWCTDNGLNLNGGSAAVGSWVAISTSPLWFVRQSSTGFTNMNIDIKIRKGTGPELDTGNFLGQAAAGL